MSIDKKPMNKKLKIALTTVLIIVVLALCAIFVARYSSSLVSEGQVELETQAAALPEDFDTSVPDGAVAYINSLTQAAKDNTVSFVDRNISVEINDESITYNGSESEKGVIKYLKNDVLSSLGECYEEHEGHFLDDFDYDISITCSADDINNVETAQGVLDDDEKLVEDERYFIKLVFNDFSLENADDEMIKTFSMQNVSDVRSAARDIVSDMICVEDSDIVCKEFEINAETDLIHNRITVVEFCKSYEIKTNIEYVGDYVSLGKRELGFEYKVRETYEFTHVTSEFTEESVMIGKNSDDQLGLAFVVGDEATSDDYKISFISSDPDRVSVNDDGVIKGLVVSADPVVITMKFEYLGNTYIDTCEVYVLNRVESLLVFPDKITLSDGETVLMSLKIKPDDATVKDVLWFTEDDTVAVVDENGRVTAVSNGKTKIYAVSVDGHYRDSCTVTVSD